MSLAVSLVDEFGNPIIGDQSQMEASAYRAGMRSTWFTHVEDLPPFTFITIANMMRDPTLILGLAMRESPICTAEFGYRDGDQWVQGVYSSRPQVARWVYKTLQRVWTYEVHKMLTCQVWGWSGGETVWKINDDEELGRKMVAFDELQLAQPTDVRTVRHKKKGLVAVSVQNATRVMDGNYGKLRLSVNGKGWFASHKPEPGSDYGLSVLRGAYSPFADKWFNGGALDVRRLVMHADAYSGRRIGYPLGTTEIEGLGSIPNINIARKMTESSKSGDVVTYPLVYDDRGREKWRIEDAKNTVVPTHIMEYPKDLDVAMLRGIEIPDEVLITQITGAWQGKKVPLEAFWNNLRRFGMLILRDVVHQIIEPGVLWNFGKAYDFEVSLLPFDIQLLFAEQAAARYAQGAMGGGGGGMGGMAGMFGQGGDMGFNGAEATSPEQVGSQRMSTSRRLFAEAHKQGLEKDEPIHFDAVDAVGAGVIEASQLVRAAENVMDSYMMRQGIMPYYDDDLRHELKDRKEWNEKKVNGKAVSVHAMSTLADDIAKAMREKVEAAEQETDTEATEAQKEAGNYRKGKLTLHGLKICIESPKGSWRNGVDDSGKAWKSKLHSTYGYIQRTEGNDGDHVDCFIGPHPESELVFVIDQCDADGSFDEHKVMLGYVSAASAEECYLACYQKGWKCGPITAMTLPEFKTWLDGSGCCKPASESVRMATQPEQPVAETSSGSGNSPWTRYKGPREGIGWANSQTGEVRYQEDMPTDGSSGQPDSAAPAEAAPEQPVEDAGYPTHPELSQFFKSGGTPVEIRRLLRTKNEPQSIANAISRMQQASQGTLDKRVPIDILATSNNDLFVVDGNSTVGAAAQMGMSHVAVKVHKLSDYVNAHVNAAFLDNDFEDGLPTKSPFTDEASLVQAAEQAMDGSPASFQAVLDLGEGLSRDVGGVVTSYEEMMRAKTLDRPAILIAKVKGEERRREKVNGKYKGDWTRLTDMVRATVVADAHQFPAVISSLRENLARRGWKIVNGSVDNKFDSPTEAGYSDVSMHLQGPNGVIAELQINTLEMWQAKEHTGHKLYEDYRRLDELKREKTPEEQSQLMNLANKMKQLYGRAQARILRKYLNREKASQ